MKKLLFFFCINLLGFFIADTAYAAPPANFQTTLKIGSGLDNPTGFEIAPDGRIFILQRTGEVKIVKNGQLQPNNFTVLPSVVTGDRGLIGIALDPDFLNNHFIYFYFTDTDLRNRLVRFDASGDIGTNGPVILYETTTQSFQYHVGGTVQFGKDGKLYLSIGDNGTPSNAQTFSNVFGKIIRLNKDGTIPPDNPFVTTANAKPEIWAYGLRNPFRFQFDSVTGNMYEGDVGEATWEEVNLIKAGRNYGWPNCEGICNPSNVLYTDPLYTYNHNGKSAAVVGGPVYHGQVFPAEYQGRLFFGDYALGFLRTMALDADGNNAGVFNFDTNAGSVVDMKVDPRDGTLYYLTIIPGNLYQVTYSTGTKVPVANASSNVTKGTAPLTVNFSSNGSNDPNGLPITYRWDLGDKTISTDPNPTKMYNNNGKYTVQLTVSNGTYSALASSIIIQVGTPPSVTINTPANGANYRSGDVINYSITATNSTGQTLGDSSISTIILFHHQTHIHPFFGPIAGKTGQFTIPTTGEGSADTWFEIAATGTDANGLTTTAVSSIFPLKSNISFNANVNGLQFLLDGQPTTTPITVQGVVNFMREISAPFLQVLNGTVYSFHRWSDDGAYTHTVKVQNSDTSFTATFDQTTPFSGQYFTNQTLSGTPALTRQDNIINFDWGNTPPSPAIPHDRYSVRWTKTQYFPAGRYIFTTASDDGNRLYIDNNLVIDAWRDQGLTSTNAPVDLTAGNHDIRMEYYQNMGGAIVSLDWTYPVNQPSVIPTPTSVGEQRLGGMNLDGYCKSQGQNGTALSGNTWTCTPSGTAINMTNACRWQYNPNAFAKQDVANNPYTWSCYVSGTLPTPTSTPTATPTPQPSTNYQGKYWNLPTNATFPPSIPTSVPNLTRSDPTINFTWNYGSPASQINVDRFIAQWTKTQNFTAGTYTFTLTSDDGSRVYIDNQLILSQWSDHVTTTITANRNLTAGNHIIRVDYYERTGGANVKFSFVKN